MSPSAKNVSPVTNTENDSRCLCLRRQREGSGDPLPLRGTPPGARMSTLFAEIAGMTVGIQSDGASSVTRI
jgi:hypothetical protein